MEIFKIRITLVQIFKITVIRMILMRIFTIRMIRILRTFHWKTDFSCSMVLKNALYIVFIVKLFI